MHFSLILLTFVTISTATPVKRASGTVLQGIIGSDGYWNDYDGGVNEYTQYSGNGSRASGWPGVEQWISFNSMWIANQHIMERSCDQIYNVSNNSPEEIKDLYDAIKTVAHESRVDHRFILAAIMQETKGCVRAHSSKSPDGIHNPGILQDFMGTHTCNEDGKILTPCPKDQILGMIRDGVGGTEQGHGFAEDIGLSSDIVNGEVAMAYYRGARHYNSGEVPKNGVLEEGSATHCYASDIANRLTGWTDAASKCTFDANPH